MLEVIFPVVTLGGLALFILWESWQRRNSAVKPLARATMEHGFKPGATNKENVVLTLAIVGFILGLYMFNNPPHPPFTGRYSTFSSIFYASFGPLGEPVLILVCSVAAFIATMSMRRQRLEKKRTHRAS